MDNQSDKLLVLDLDDTIIKTEPNIGWSFKPGILRKIYDYHHNLGYLIVIVTNQGGIDMGYQKPSEVKMKIQHVIDEISIYLNDVMGDNGFSFTNHNINVGLHKGHLGRKPLAGNFIKKYPNADMENSIFVGDAMGLAHKIENSDIETVYLKGQSPDGGLQDKWIVKNDAGTTIVIDEKYGNIHKEILKDSTQKIRTKLSTYALVGYSGTGAKIKKIEQIDFSNSDLIFAKNAGFGKCYHVSDFLSNKDKNLI